MVDFYGIHVGKYISPMDPMGIGWSSKQIKGIQNSKTRCDEFIVSAVVPGYQNSCSMEKQLL